MWQSVVVINSIFNEWIKFRIVELVSSDLFGNLCVLVWVTVVIVCGAVSL